MEDKFQDYIDDMKSYGVYSDCCGAEIILGDICSQCRDHCDAIEEEE